MTFEEILHHRRSVRLFQKTPIDPEVVQGCLEQAVLAPNSSNMQLWGFYHIVDAKMLEKFSALCLNQLSASSAQQLVVFVTRQDLFWSRSRKMIVLESQNVHKTSPKEKQEKRVKRWEMYYGKVMPFLYARFFGLLGLLRKILVYIVGLFRPIFYQVSEGDMRVVVHKSCALAAQTFMLAMANQGYDTCPMEGFDSRRVKRLLKLPMGAEINMIISCGIRADGGVWGDRMRIPFDEVYERI